MSRKKVNKMGKNISFDEKADHPSQFEHETKRISDQKLREAIDETFRYTRQ